MEEKLSIQLKKLTIDIDSPMLVSETFNICITFSKRFHRNV